MHAAKQHVVTYAICLVRFAGVVARGLSRRCVQYCVCLTLCRLNAQVSLRHEAWYKWMPSLLHQQCQFKKDLRKCARLCVIDTVLAECRVSEVSLHLEAW